MHSLHSFLCQLFIDNRCIVLANLGLPVQRDTHIQFQLALTCKLQRVLKRFFNGVKCQHIPDFFHLQWTPNPSSNHKGNIFTYDTPTQLRLC